MKFSKIIIFLLLISFSKTIAQKFELGKVSINELQEKVHPIDTTAVAAILFNKARTFLVMILKTDLASIRKTHSELKFIKKKD